MMLLNTLGTAPLQPARYSLDNEGDDGHSFHSSLEALVNAVANEYLEEEIEVEQEPSNSDGTAALMMLLAAPATWDRMREPSAQALATARPSGSRGLEVPVCTYPSIPNCVDLPVVEDSDVVAPQHSATPMVTDAQDKDAVPADMEMQAPAATPSVPAMRMDQPAIEKGPPQLPREIPSQGSPVGDAVGPNATAPTECEGSPSTEIRHLDEAGDQDAMFLPSPRLVVRNSVPRSTQPEQTAFEVEISEEIEKKFQLEESRDVPSPKLSKESRNIDDRDIADGSVSALRGVTQTTTHRSAETQPPQPEVPKANEVTPIATTSSTAKESFSPSENVSPERQPSAPAAMEHTQDKPRAFQASTGLQLRVGPREEVSIHVNQIAGNVRISVRSVDADLTRELQAGVPNLLAVLNETGVRAEATVPEIGSPIAERRETTISNIANGSSASSQEGSGNASGEPSGQNRRHRRPDQQWEEWLEER